jgi:predicted Zn-dependent protease
MLEPPDIHHLRAAQGWLELGNSEEAASEFRQLSPKAQDEPDALEVRWALAAAARNWDACVATGSALIAAAPDRPSGWIHRSFALHELKRTREAADLLLPAAERFPAQWLIRYNLACYTCQLGDRAGAWHWLQKALRLGNPLEIRRMALKDPDLSELAGKIREGLPPKS